MPEDELGRLIRLGEAIAGLGNAEFRVVETLVERLAMGQRQYGRYDVATDTRSMRRELRNELVDALVYIVFEEGNDAEGGR